MNIGVIKFYEDLIRYILPDVKFEWKVQGPNSTPFRDAVLIYLRIYHDEWGFHMERYGEAKDVGWYRGRIIQRAFLELEKWKIKELGGDIKTDN